MQFRVRTGSLSRLSCPILKWLPETKVFVEPHELDAYRAHWPNAEISAHPRSGMGFSGMMNELIRDAIRCGERYFYFCDDDVTSLRVRDSLTGKFRGDMDFRHELDRWAEVVQRSAFAVGAISFSGASWMAKKLVDFPVGAWGMYLIDTLAAQSVGGFDESLSIFGDWEYSARLLSRGFGVARTNQISFVHKMKSMSGGAAEIYKKKQLIQSAAIAVQARYGRDVVRIEYVDVHEQDEIRVNWRKLRDKFMTVAPPVVRHCL